MKRVLLSGVSIAGLCISSGIAFAQSTSPNAAETLPTKIETIEVTADRKHSFSADLVQAGTFRGARIQDTPLTVTVIPLDLIQSQQGRTLLDALKNSAGVTQSQISAAVYNNLSIRGISVENRGNYRLDGALPIVNLVDLPLEDKARVETLKGVSALYYGFTTPAGIVNLTMQRPPAEREIFTEVFGDNNGSLATHASYGNTWGDFGALFNGVIGSVGTGINNTDGDRKLASAAFDYKPMEKLKFTLDTEYIYKSVSEPTEWSLNAPVNGVTTLPPLLDPKVNFGAKWMRASGTEYNILGHVAYSLSDAWNVTFDGGTSWLERNRYYSTFQNYNLATGAGKEVITLTNANRYQNVTYRGEVAGVVNTGPLRHELVLGVSSNVRYAEVPSNPSVTVNQNYLNPIDIPEIALPARVIPNPSVIDDRGYYAFDTAKFQNWLNLLVGVRHTDYSNVSLTSNYKVNIDTPSGGVVVKPIEWLSLYGTYINGLEEGGIAPPTAKNANQELPANQSTQKEAGIKAEPLKGMLIQTAYFDIKRPSSFLNSTGYYVQDGIANYRGYEFSVTGEITDRLSIFANALSLRAKQANGSSAAVTGKNIENTAHLTWSTYLQYKVPYIEGLSINGGVYFVGARAVNATNTATVPGYTLVNLGGSYTTAVFGHEATFRLTGENIAGVKYWAATGSSLLAQGLPSTIKFTVSSHF